MILLGARAGAFWFGKRQVNFSGEKNVILVDNGFRYNINSSVENVKSLIESQGISLGADDRVYPGLAARVTPGLTVEIERAMPVVIEVDRRVIEKNVFATSVSGALAGTGVTMSHLDKVEPGKDTVLQKDMEIVVTRINIEEVTAEEKIDFKTVEKEDDDLRWRRKKVKQEGEKGLEEVTYRVTYKNGKKISKEELSSKVLKKPVKEIVRIGTKVEVGKTKVGVASWYTHAGTMACASRMFPRGTWLRVTNRENGKRVFVQVNDFGPMRGTGKMIDLDKVAFEKLAPLGKGVIEVKVEEILE